VSGLGGSLGLLDSARCSILALHAAVVVELQMWYGRRAGRGEDVLADACQTTEQIAEGRCTGAPAPVVAAPAVDSYNLSPGQHEVMPS
jgi:hypothetical protein